jgi:ABC-type multidrug transport system ATPase subunit
MKGKSIICTVHQPSSQVFEIFDKLLLIAEGKLAYLGPTRASQEFFTRYNNLNYYQTIQYFALTFRWQFVL